MVRRAMYAPGTDKKLIDQTMLAKAVQTLSGANTVSDEDIAVVLPDDANENVYELLSSAIRGDRGQVERMLSHLKATDDPYRLFALIASQWFQLVALSVTTNSSQDVAHDLNAHPFVIQKLSAHRTRFSRHELRMLSELMAKLDLESKTTSADPWHSVERFLIGTLNT